MKKRRCFRVYLHIKRPSLTEWKSRRWFSRCMVVLQAHDPSNRAARGSLTQAIVYVLTFTFPAVIQVTTFLRKTRVGKICFMVVMWNVEMWVYEWKVTFYVASQALMSGVGFTLVLNIGEWTVKTLNGLRFLRSVGLWVIYKNMMLALRLVSHSFSNLVMEHACHDDCRDVKGKNILVDGSSFAMEFFLNVFTEFSDKNIYH